MVVAKTRIGLGLDWDWTGTGLGLYKPQNTIISCFSKNKTF